VDTLSHSLFFGLPKNLGEAENFFGSISSGSSVLLGHLLALLITAIIVFGNYYYLFIVKWSLILIFLLLIILGVWAATLPGAWEGY